MDAYSLRAYSNIYLILGSCHNNFNAAIREYAEQYPERRHPIREVFRRLDDRMRTTGHVIPVQSADAGQVHFRPTPQLEERVLQPLKRMKL
ncbi:hypothetical protein ANN_18975 [Periplaneta americana]|uniref:DUF4817 domain-containing protein n=1 Tax=Periplaneta americana TaxID=6978 RepID=A0ABQ8SQ81_PERAM|nr:hypothetical protein ANN_18975 [Periplaneta americana]